MKIETGGHCHWTSQGTAVQRANKATGKFPRR